MKLITQETPYIETSAQWKLRSLVSQIATDTDLDLEGVFSWFNEDNIGDIQVNCSNFSIASFEEAINIIEDNIDTEDSEYEFEDLNLLKSLLEIMYTSISIGYDFIYIKD